MRPPQNISCFWISENGRELVKILKDIKCNFISYVLEPIFTIVADNTWLNYSFAVSPKGTIIDGVTLGTR